MKKILFVAPRFHTNQYYLTKGLIQEGYEVTFGTIGKGMSESYDYLNPVILKKSIFYRSNNKNVEIFRKKFIPSIREAFRLCKKHDVVIVRNLKPRYAIIYSIAAKFLAKKVILYTQNPVFGKYSRNRILLFNLIKFFRISHYSPVLGNEDFRKLPNTNYIPFIIEPLVDINKLTKPNSVINFVAIGKMQDRKNLIELVNVFSTFPNKFHLTIIGENSNGEHQIYYEKLKEKIIDVPNINVLTNLPYSKVIGKLKKSDGYILVSDDEPAAFSILEAMANGLFVINTTSNGTSGYIHGNGFVLNQKNWEVELRNILNHLKINDIYKMKVKSLKLVAKEHFIAKYLHILE